MHSPAVDEIMAELLLSGEVSFQGIDLFNLDRFERPVRITEKSFI